MSSGFAGAVVLSLAVSLAPARVTSPMGRAPKPGHGLSVPKMWQDRTGHFALERPTAERWMLRSGVRGPDGEPVPLLAMSQETGAQLVVQSADGIHDIRLLARMLMENLAGEARVHVEDVQRVLARGGEAGDCPFRGLVPQLLQRAEGKGQQGGARLRLGQTGGIAERAQRFGEERDLPAGREHRRGVIERTRLVGGQERRHSQAQGELRQVSGGALVGCRNAGGETTESSGSITGEWAKGVERAGTGAPAP